MNILRKRFINWLAILTTAAFACCLYADDKAKPGDLEALLLKKPNLETFGLNDVSWQADVRKAPANLQGIVDIMAEDPEAKGFDWLATNILSMTATQEEDELSMKLVDELDRDLFQPTPDTIQKLKFWLKERGPNLRTLLNKQVRLPACRFSGSSLKKDLTRDYITSLYMLLFASATYGGPGQFSNDAALIVKSLQHGERCTASLVSSGLSTFTQTRVFRLAELLVKKGSISSVQSLINAYGTDKELNQRLKRFMIAEFWRIPYLLDKLIAPTYKEIDQRVRAEFPDSAALFEPDWVLTEIGGCYSGLIDAVDKKDGVKFSCKDFKISADANALVTNANKSLWCRIKHKVFGSDSCLLEGLRQANELQPPFLSRSAVLMYAGKSFEQTVHLVQEEAERLSACVETLKNAKGPRSDHLKL